MCKKALTTGEELMCSDCEKAAEDSKAEYARKAEETKYKMLSIRWRSICPESYRKSQIAKLPAEMASLYKTWNCKEPESIYMKGPSGIGKTSAAFIFARASHFEGLKVSYWQASDLRQRAIKAASSEEKFDKFKKEFLHADLIILDDFGNTAKTAASDEHLLSLLEGIKAKEITTITTTQHHGKELVESFHNSSIGMAISNRVQNAIRIDLFAQKELPN